MGLVNGSPTQRTLTQKSIWLEEDLVNCLERAGHITSCILRACMCTPKNLQASLFVGIFDIIVNILHGTSIMLSMSACHCNHLSLI